MAMVPVRELLEESRRELLDLGVRNRLLSMPEESKSAKIVTIKDEKSDHVLRLLVEDRKPLSFLPGVEKKSTKRKGSSGMQSGSVCDEALAGELTSGQPDAEADESEYGLPQPDEEVDTRSGEARRHIDTKLQTSLSSEKLQTRLLSLYRDAALFNEEQGINILYLAVGKLIWYEDPKSDRRRAAPLILVPVQLQRQSAKDRFVLTWAEEDPQPNITLGALLETQYGLRLPEFPAAEECIPSQYAASVAGVVASMPRWSVDPDSLVLGLFSFAKHLMHRDLDSSQWPESLALKEDGVIAALLRDGFPGSELPWPNEDPHLDEIIPASQLDHVVDADGSQTLAIALVRRGGNAVVQGPPGTGKSQSIANILSTAVLDGKRVLFVAEKLAALEVVKRRLVAAGLGDLCLELHSRMAKKKLVLDELRRTWELGKPKGPQADEVNARLERTRGELNAHASRLHKLIGKSGLTAYGVMGRLARLGERGAMKGEVALVGAENWTPDEVRDRRESIAEAASRIDSVGVPAQSIWFGVGREELLSIDIDRISAAAEAAAKTVEVLLSVASAAANSLKTRRAETLAQAEHHARVVSQLAACPPVEMSEASLPVWGFRSADIAALVASGEALAAARAALPGGLPASALEADLTGPAAVYAARGKSLFRIFSGEYRQSVAILKQALGAGWPASYDQRVALLNDLARVRIHLLAVRMGEALGREAFGARWQGENSEWKGLRAVSEWSQAADSAGIGDDCRSARARAGRPEDAAAQASALMSACTAAGAAMKALAEEFAVDLKSVFGADSINAVPLDHIPSKAAAWAERIGELMAWTRWRKSYADAVRLGAGAVADRVADGSIAADVAVDAFERAYLAGLMRAAVRAHPELARFEGAKHDKLVEEFRNIDRQRLAVAKLKVLQRHHRGLPAKVATGATGVLLSEFERKRGHRPIKKLMRDAGTAVQAIKPIFMMSPLSVAQFLELGAVQFDLLVIDEASQVEPVDALGAFIRSKQWVVVGDSKQMPPTRFFAKMTGEDEPADDDEFSTARVKDVESILGLCCMRGIRQTMLRWHYRSRHQSLIAVSNREFYDQKLFIVPSPEATSASRGLSFQFVEGGCYDRGGERNNRVEARAVCLAVIEHARLHPDQSLGVAAFSMAQQQLILDEIEHARRENPDTEDFFGTHPHEPFFVKNLENVQGDERDVIFISVGYGPDSSGRFSMVFGPLMMEGGERRLNVLISRAKMRCRVFASFRAHDLDVEKTRSLGVRALRTFLAFAESGTLGALGDSSDREEESVFEEAVRAEIEAMGYRVVPQVGVAGFFVDLGIVDPKRPGRFMLGVECDGAQYHSSRSARDRDRLRQSILEDHGWRLHRIWSTDWFQNQKQQRDRLAAAIAMAESESANLTAAADAAVVSQGASSDSPSIEREEAAEIGEEQTVSISFPYKEANFGVPKQPPHELQPAEMAKVLLRIIEIEGPIHEEELITRVRDLWCLGRAGSRVRGAVGEGIRHLADSRRVVASDAWFAIPGTTPQVRSRTAVTSAGLRKPEMLPPEEIRQAILEVLKACHGATEPEAMQALAKTFGLKLTSTLKEAFAAGLADLLRLGKIREQGGRLVCA